MQVLQLAACILVRCHCLSTDRRAAISPSRHQHADWFRLVHVDIEAGQVLMQVYNP